MTHEGKTITDLMDMVEKQLCGECYGYGEVSEQLPWPSLDYKQVPCKCPAGDKLAAEQAATVGPNFWRGLTFGFICSLPVWALLAWDWFHGMVR